MKTLDEVIIGIKEQMGLGDPILIDALHYLNTIETTENLYHDAVNELSKWIEEDWKDRCLPLTWDELRQMEGKPVWVEMEGYKPNWGIVMNQDKENGRLLLCGYDEAPIRIEINEKGEGKTWQAYKKEKYE